MVWGVCRRLLRRHQDAEDAFQATFLVLVRKAASVVPREKVANWLYGVAHQTALYARATAAKRSTREKQVTDMPEPTREQQDQHNDLQALLDQELSRLPDKYREVLVLCDLEGKTRKESARQLKVPEGTVASRLATARTMLAKRLTRQGVVLSGGTLAVLLSRNLGAASVPASVVSSTIQAASLYGAGQAAAPGVISIKAVAFAEGVLKTMLMSKLKIATVILLALAVLGAGAVALAQRVLADKSANQIVKEKQVAAESPVVPPVKEKEKPADQPPVKEKPASAVQSGKEQAEKNAHAQKPELQACEWARVETIDVVKNTITFDDKAPPAVAGKTFSLAKDARIAIDRKPGKLADLPPGAFLHGVGLSADRRSILSFDAEGPQLGCLTPARVETIDVAKNTITFDDKAPGVVAGETFSVAPNANIVIDGKRGKLTDLPPGAFLSLSLSADSRSILQFDAQGPNVHDCTGSPVKAVDREKNTITFDDKARADLAGKTFRVASDANILIDGKRGQLTDLPAGSYVNLGLCVDRYTARHVSAQGPTLLCDCGGSQVKAIDVEKNTITFADKARAEVAGKTFTVARDANITINGKPGRLAELSVGFHVSAGLRVDQKTIGTIHAKAP
jgi:RNA polymerase sigma factor (sigma-70 family)